jgi:phenylpyruvate tautomerase PptA (4-oxalocrotonate tautomerase family)
MPTYVCSAATGRLTPVQKTEIVCSITAIHHGSAKAINRPAVRRSPTGMSREQLLS